MKTPPGALCGAPKVVNRYKTKDYDEYIGRGSRWGNEFIIGVHGTRAEVIEKYRLQLIDKIDKGLVTDEDLLSLANKRIACFCAPHLCHGDVIADQVQLVISKLNYKELGMSNIPELYNIEKYLFEFLESNPAKGLPYHNNRHMKGVFAIASQILVRETDQVKVYAETMVPLLFTTLLHDYGHSGGNKPDAENIAIAIDALGVAIDECPHKLPEDLYGVVRDAILCTEFPFKYEPSNLLEKIMRDADILYATMENDPTVIMEGLRKEVQVSQNKKIGYLEMYENQVNFASNAKFYTDAGRTMWEENSTRFLEQMEDYAMNKESKKKK